MSNPSASPSVVLKPWEVRAILDGRATTLARRVKPQPPVGVVCPFGAPGTEIWCRETFRPEFDGEDWYIRYRAGGTLEPQTEETECEIMALSRPDGISWEGQRAMDGISKAWLPATQMPLWASRLTLLNKSVRVVRAQEVGEQDAVALGMHRNRNGVWHWLNDGGIGGRSPVDVFAMVFDADHGPGAWERNPWCWLMDFSVKEKVNA